MRSGQLGEMGAHGFDVAPHDGTGQGAVAFRQGVVESGLEKRSQNGGGIVRTRGPQELHRLRDEGDQVVGAMREARVVEAPRLLGHPHHGRPELGHDLGGPLALTRARGHPEHAVREPIEVACGPGEGHRRVQCHGTRADPGGGVEDLSARDYPLVWTTADPDAAHRSRPAGSRRSRACRRERSAAGRRSRGRRRSAWPSARPAAGRRHAASRRPTHRRPRRCCGRVIATRRRARRRPGRHRSRPRGVASSNFLAFRSRRPPSSREPVRVPHVVGTPRMYAAVPARRNRTAM